MCKPAFVKCSVISWNFDFSLEEYPNFFCILKGIINGQNIINALKFVTKNSGEKIFNTNNRLKNTI